MSSILRDGHSNLTFIASSTHLPLELCPDEEKQPFLQTSISSSDPQRNAHSFVDPNIQLNPHYQTLLLITTSPIGYP
jgi:hypothetical protein